MKLPRGYRVGMKSLGRADINAPTRTFNAEQQVTQSMAGAASAVADLVGLGFRLHDEEQKTEARDRSLEIQRDLNQLHGENSATQQWDLEDDFQREKLEGVKFEKKSPDGQLRTVLSAAEVHSQVWTINRDKIVKQGLTGLNPDQQKRVMEDLRYPVSNLNSRTKKRSISLKAIYLREKDI